MDKQLLKALDNLSDSLEKIAEVLKKKSDDKGGKSATTTALQGGDFGKSLQEISAGVKSIKVDTQKILQNQQTILSMQKKTDVDKKTGAFQQAGGTKEQEDKLKKGIGIILLIAVAVLAIGLAFKIIGKIDFLSVIGLSVAILIMAVAFEKVAKLQLDPIKAAMTAGVLVIIALAITISSWIMGMIKPIGITQFLTATFIAITFAAMSKYLVNIFIATAVFSRMKVSKKDLILTLVSISAAITASSLIMQFIKPISLGQGITAVFIALTFALIGYNLHKIGLAVAMFKKIPGLKSMDLVWVLLAISTAITVSSYVLQFIKPLGFMQLITGILIATMFLIIAFKMERIAIGVAAFKRTEVSAKDLLFVMVGIAAAITASSYVLNFILPVGIWQILTALGIAILFAIMSYVLPELAAGIALVGKLLGTSKVFLIPLVMVAISLAIMMSSLILQFTAPIPFVELLRILLFSVVLAVATVVVGLAAFILAVVFKSKNIKEGSKSIVILAAAIAAASQLFALGDYSLYPDYKWTLQSTLSILAFGLIAFALNKLGKPTDYMKGGLSIVIIAATIMITSLILNIGEYKNYPSLKWLLGVGASIAAFAIAANLLGASITNPFFYGGLAVIAIVAAVIVATSFILNTGQYKNYPSLSWVLGVGASIAGFAVGALALGLNALNPLFYVGLPMIVLVAKTIVEVSKELAKGKYVLPGLGTWAASVALLFTTFTPLIVLLGAIGTAGAVMEFFGAENPFEKGREMLKQIAQTIVDVAGIISKGKFTGGPKEEWARAVGIAIGAFSPVYEMLVRGAIFKAFGIGVGPTEFNEAIKTVTGGIVFAAQEFANNKVAFKEGPPESWARGVGAAIGAFAPVYQVLAANSGWFKSGVSVEDMKNAIMTISQGIVDAAVFFSENTAPFEEGKYPSENWGRGVGGALNAFAPVFESLSGKSWYQSGNDVLKSMSSAITTIARSIVVAAYTLSLVKPEMWQSYPPQAWGSGIEASITKFMNLFKLMKGKVDLSPVTRVVSQMVFTARTLFFNRRFFQDTNYLNQFTRNVVNTRGAIYSFAYLNRMLEPFKKYFINEYLSPTTRVSRSLVRTAKILHGAKDAFKLQIDPNYVKNVGQNMLDFNELVKKLAESESEGTGFFGRLGNAAEGLLGTDPISQIANRMITLAKGYDAMAEALIKMGYAMKMLNVDSLKQLGGFTRSILGEQPMGEEEGAGSMKSQFVKTGLSGMGSPSVSTDVKIDPREKLIDPRKNSISYVSEKLEELIKIMVKIERSTSTIDEGMEQLAGIKPPPEISEFG